MRLTSTKRLLLLRCTAAFQLTSPSLPLKSPFGTGVNSAPMKMFAFVCQPSGSCTSDCSVLSSSNRNQTRTENNQWTQNKSERTFRSNRSMFSLCHLPSLMLIGLASLAVSTISGRSSWEKMTLGFPSQNSDHRFPGSLLCIPRTSRSKTQYMLSQAKPARMVVVGADCCLASTENEMASARV